MCILCVAPASGLPIPDHIRRAGSTDHESGEEVVPSVVRNVATLFVNGRSFKHTPESRSFFASPMDPLLSFYGLIHVLQMLEIGSADGDLLLSDLSLGCGSLSIA